MASSDTLLSAVLSQGVSKAVLNVMVSLCHGVSFLICAYQFFVVAVPIG